MGSPHTSLEDIQTYFSQIVMSQLETQLRESDEGAESPEDIDKSIAYEIHSRRTNELDRMGHRLSKLSGESYSPIGVLPIFRHVWEKVFGYDPATSESQKTLLNKSSS